MNIGLDGVLLYDSTVGNTPTVEMTNVRDLSYSDERGEGDISTRGSSFELSKTTMRKFAIEFEMVVNDDDTDYAAMLAAYEGNLPVAFICKSKSDGAGIEADFYVVKFTRSENLRDAQYVSVSIKPTYIARYPSWISAS